MKNSQNITRAKEIGRNLISVFDGYRKGNKSESFVRNAVFEAIQQLPCYTYEGEVYECGDTERNDLKEYVEDMFRNGIDRRWFGFGSNSILYTIFNDLASEIIGEHERKASRTGMACMPISACFTTEAEAAHERVFGKNWRDIYNGL